MSQNLLYRLDNSSLAFPPVHHALNDPNGLLAIGGDLSSKRLISAYSQGIFPWYNEGEPIMWWSPNPRALIFLDSININKTLKKVIKRKQFTVTLNSAFEQVLNLCADAPFRIEDTWITEEMKTSYLNLHKSGHAHSIEVWQDEQLIGGLYGVAIKGYFSGESMFYKKSNASKLALVALTKLLKQLDITFIDCQISNPFLTDMGCREISRSDFIILKETAINKMIPVDFWHRRIIDL